MPQEPQNTGRPEPDQKSQPPFELDQVHAQVLAHVPHFAFWKDADSIYLGCNQRFAE